jgi:anti-sigma factor RsiW
MNCAQTKELIDAGLDGELDLLTSLDLKRHVECCPSCAHEQERLQAVKSTIAAAPYYDAPPELARRIGHSLRSEIAPPMRFRFLRRTLAIAACLAVVVSLGWLAAQHFERNVLESRSRELVAAHVRSLMADHLLDVPSSDQHTVKPWFTGKLDFAPEVRDLTDAGFPLQGGRLDYLDGRPVAALVYRHNRHVINCFVRPDSTAESLISTSTAQGYCIVQFTHHRLRWQLISDAAPATLEQLARALAAQ